MNKKLIITSLCASALMIFSPTSFAQGVPTVDAAALANMAQQAARDIAHYASVLEDLKTQIQTQQNQLQSMTGIKDMVNLNQDLQNLTQTATSIKDVFNNPNKYFNDGLAALPNDAKELMDKYGVNELCDQYKNRASFKKLCEAELTAKVATSYQNNLLIEQLNNNITRLSELSVKASNSPDIKTSQDIANQIAIVNGNIQVIQHSLTAAYNQQESFKGMVDARRKIEIENNRNAFAGVEYTKDKSDDEVW